MSQDFLDPELIADFIVESKEHLETIEPNLLELEKAPDNLNLLNEIFRPMHSLKGASGFLGLNRINLLAHRSENILDELRKGTMVVTPEIMDVILASTDALRQMVDNLEATNSEGDVPIDHIIAQIDALMSGQTAAPQDGSSEQASAEGSASQNASSEQSSPEEAEAAPAPAPEVAAPATETQESASDTSPAPAAPSDTPRAERKSMSTLEWIESLPRKETVTLTSFGEGHLKDFIDEARENTENLNSGLLELEKNPGENKELVNDLFRYFHNLKGNSGIIDYKELNGLTHEAETLLNRARQGELTVTHELIDLLLVVVDVMDALISAIDPTAGTATPFDASELLAQLQQAVAGGPIALPPSLRSAPEASPAPETPPLQPAGADRNEDDLDMFRTAVRQQQAIIKDAMTALGQDSSLKEKQDALYRCLVAIQNSAHFMGFEPLKVYAERTAGLVDQARKSDMDFSLMMDLLRQELSIIDDMIEDVLKAPSASGAGAAAPAAAAEQPKKTEEKKSTPVSAGGTAAVSTPAVPQKAPQPAPAAPQKAPQPAAPKAAPAPAAKPAAKPAAPAASPAARPATGAATAAPANKSASSSIRVDHEKLDHLMNLIGELLINRNRYAMIAKTLETSPPDQVDVAQVAQDISETTYAMARVSDELQDTIMKVRMVPVSSVFSRFPRLVRDLSRKSGKEVELILEGEETELDKSVVEVINDPLMHLIRNSVDHGIEPAEVRIAAGKPEVGKVWLRAYHKGNSVAIEIEDDGKGIDPEKMREVAVKKKIITPEEAKNLDDREAIDLIFAPGFSSAEKITDISGRGVGMDVVRTNIKNLKGSVSTFSRVGKGTRFTLSLPLTLAIIEALMIKMGDQVYAIPLDAVATTTKLESARLTDVKGRKAVTMRGEVLGIVELGELLNLHQHKTELPEVLSVVIIQDNERRLGLVVDHLLDRQEIVIKSLGTYLSDVRGLSGASIMGDGNIVLILDPHEIYMMATSKAI